MLVAPAAEHKLSDSLVAFPMLQGSARGLTEQLAKAHGQYEYKFRSWCMQPPFPGLGSLQLPLQGSLSRPHTVLALNVSVLQGPCPVRQH